MQINRLVLIVFFIFLIFPKAAIAQVDLFKLLNIEQQPQTASTRAPADSAGDERRIETLKFAIKEAQLFLHMDHVYYWITEQTRCSEDVRIMKRTFKEAEDLDRTYANNPTAEYQKKLREIKRFNKTIREEFEACFTYMLKKNNLEDWNSHNVYDYASFKSVFAKLRNRFGNKDVEAYLQKLRDELVSLSENHAGEFLGVRGDVQIYRGGKWITAKQEMKVYVNDEIRTGSVGYANVKFMDKDTYTGAGPTVIYIGVDSHATVEKFNVRFSGAPRRDGIVNLIQGTLRAITKGWKSGVFSVRTGTTVAGMRGTDLSVNYDPRSNKVQYSLNHGIVDVESPNKKVTLRGGQKLAVKRGNFGPVDALSENDWMRVVSKTSARGSSLIGRTVPKTIDAELVLESVNEGMTAFKYRMPEEMLRWTTGVYNDFLPKKVSTAEGMNELNQNGRMPRKWNALCLGKCPDSRTCHVYVDLWFDKTKDTELPEAYIHVVKKESGVWKLADNIPVTKKIHGDYENKMYECGLR